jgi:hypothetical protein
MSGRIRIGVPWLSSDLLWEIRSGVTVLAKYAAFYVREGFALGILIGVVLAVFMPYELWFKIIGFVFAVVVSLAACAVQLRRAGKRGDHRD